MTQILGGIRLGHLLQASDRELSHRIAGGLRPADHRSNKSIILVTGKDVSLIGYTGNAVMDGLPTDDWLAGAITATSSDHWAVPTHDNLLQHYSVGQVVQSLRRSVDAYRKDLPPVIARDFYLEVQVIGYRLRRRVFTPYMFKEIWDGPTTHLSAHDRPLVASLQLGVVLASPALEPDVHAKVHRETSRPAPRPADFLNNMASAMTEVANSRPGVGESLLGISLDIRTMTAFVNHRIERPDRAKFGDGHIPLLWTPWIIVPHRFNQPQMTSGGELVIPPLRIVLPDTPNPPGTIGVIQKRLRRDHNADKTSISHEFETSRMDVHLEAGRHEFVAEIKPAPYAPPER